MNWNWIFFGNEISFILRLVRLTLVLIPLSIVFPGYFFLGEFFGFLSSGDGAIGILIIFWAFAVFVIEIILLIIYSILKKIIKSLASNTDDKVLFTSEQTEVNQSAPVGGVFETVVFVITLFIGIIFSIFYLLAKLSF